jgi:hypothetical protein
MPWLYFDGGQLDHRVDWYDVEPDPSAPLVFDGPDYIGVYERSDPLQVVPTREGPAEVWHSLS